MAINLDRTVMIKSDCVEVVNAVNGQETEWPWEFSAIAADIVGILRNHTNVRVIHCRRAEVTQAHNNANRARLGLLMPNWLANL
ncbi:hypothetical protein LINPERPRIM_LOCUS40687 [Linum perenne]